MLHCEGCASRGQQKRSVVGFLEHGSVNGRGEPEASQADHDQLGFVILPLSKYYVTGGIAHLIRHDHCSPFDETRSLLLLYSDSRNCGPSVFLFHRAVLCNENGYRSVLLNVLADGAGDYCLHE